MLGGLIGVICCSGRGCGDALFELPGKDDAAWVPRSGEALTFVKGAGW
jgi:hypothetical protein